MRKIDEHGYPFQAEWEKRQADPMPKFTEPKERLKIGRYELPPLNTNEKSPGSQRNDRRGFNEAFTF